MRRSFGSVSGQQSSTCSSACCIISRKDFAGIPFTARYTGRMHGSVTRCAFWSTGFPRLCPIRPKSMMVCPTGRFCIIHG